MGKLVLIGGLLIAGIGGLMMLGWPVGRLPGDLVYRRESFTVYLPIGTSVIASVVLTLLLLLLRR